MPKALIDMAVKQILSRKTLEDLAVLRQEIGRSKPLKPTFDRREGYLIIQKACVENQTSLEEGVTKLEAAYTAGESFSQKEAEDICMMLIASHYRNFDRFEKLINSLSSELDTKEYLTDISYQLIERGVVFAQFMMGLVGIDQCSLGAVNIVEGKLTAGKGLPEIRDGVYAGRNDTHVTIHNHVDYAFALLGHLSKKSEVDKDRLGGYLSVIELFEKTRLKDESPIYSTYFRKLMEQVK